MAESLQIKPRSRTPLTVMILAAFWFLTSFLFFFIGAMSDLLGHEIMGVVTLFLAVALIKRSRWSFWCSAIFMALCIGIDILQLQIPGWRAGRSETVLWASLALGIGILVLQELSAVLSWFQIAANKRHRVTYWLAVGFSAFVGELILPTLRALSQ